MLVLNRTKNKKKIRDGAIEKLTICGTSCHNLDLDLELNLMLLRKFPSLIIQL